jgi:Na+-transporting NADH:ubiquinone oxidoreductase subunit A
MARCIRIRKGRNLPLTGEAGRQWRDCRIPSVVRVPFYEFTAQDFRFLVQPHDRVLLGSPLLQKRNNPALVIVSPVSGRVTGIVRGERRIPEYLEIKTDIRQETVTPRPFSPERLPHLDRDEIIARMLEGGVWPFVCQRPFGRMADPSVLPQAVFVRAMDTSPLAPDINMILQGQEDDFLLGLSLVRRLTTGSTYLCHGPEAASRAIGDFPGIERAVFRGPHPAGNTGTHVHHLFSLSRGKVVWTFDVQDVIAVARLFREGVFCPWRVVALTGEGLPPDRRGYVRVMAGTPLESLTGAINPQAKVVAGNALWGVLREKSSGLGFMTNQLTILPGGSGRKFLGWLAPGENLFSFRRLFLSSFLPGTFFKMEICLNGSPRAIVLNDVYDDLVALDVLTFFLIKAILAGEIEEMERLGILECSPEDFALAAFACPSKTDIPALIARGLELMEKEGI